MPEYIELQNVNINEYPKEIREHSPDNKTALMVGDIHANGVGYGFTVLGGGILENIEKDEYEHYTANIYPKSVGTVIKAKKLTPADYQRFSVMLKNSRVNKNAPAFIRLGDGYFDRGQNDKYILDMDEKLIDSNADLSITISNHTIELIRLYELGHPFACKSMFTDIDNVPDNVSFLDGQFGVSSVNLQSMIDDPDFPEVTRTSVDAQIEKILTASLKLFAYTIDENGELTLVSHAAVGVETLEEIAEKFNVNLNDDLPIILDNIQNKFREHVRNKTVHTLFPRDEMISLYCAATRTTNPFVRLIWNRIYDENYIRRPREYKGYKMNYVHGHDLRDPGVKDNHIFNLDNDCGKFLHYHVGKVHKTLSVTLMPEHKLTHEVVEEKALVQNTVESNTTKTATSHKEPSISQLYSNLSQVVVELNEEKEQKSVEDDQSLIADYLSALNEQYNWIQPGQCISVNDIGSTYPFHAGIGGTSKEFYVANRNFQANLSASGMIFYAKIEGRVDYDNPLNYDRVVNENLFTSIVQHMKAQNQPAQNQPAQNELKLTAYQEHKQKKHKLELPPQGEPPLKKAKTVSSEERMAQLKIFMRDMQIQHCDLERGQWREVDKSFLNSKFGFQVGVSGIKNNFCIANKFIHVGINGDDISFFEKENGVVNYLDALSSEEAFQHSLFNSIFSYVENKNTADTNIKLSLK